MYCAKCGVSEVKTIGLCYNCRIKPTLEDIGCDICERPSVYMNVHGYRCQQHIGVNAHNNPGPDLQARVIVIEGKLLPSYFERIAKEPKD